MIITGAPVEHLAFDEVTYWDELKEIMEWARKKCNKYIAYLLGSTGWLILSLWHS